MAREVLAQLWIRARESMSTLNGTVCMSTPFLRSLEPVDMRTRAAKVAQQYMKVKGYGAFRPLGVITNSADDSWYFYYDLPKDGLLELEVLRNPATGLLTRRVVALVTEPDKIREYLGR